MRKLSRATLITAVLASSVSLMASAETKVRTTPAEAAAYSNDPNNPGFVRYYPLPAGEMTLPFAACQDRVFQIYKGQDKFVFFKSKNPKGNRGDVLDHGEYHKVFFEKVDGQVPPCEHDSSWIPNANIETGALLSPYYDYFEDYDNARKLAIATGEAELASIELQRRLRTKVGECISNWKGWPPKEPSRRPRLDLDASCEEIGQYFAQIYLPKFEQFRKSLAMGIDVGLAFVYEPKHLPKHVNVTLGTPHFWPRSSFAPLTPEERADLEGRIAKFAEDLAKDGPHFLKDEYEKEVAINLQTAIDLGTQFPSFFSLTSASPTPSEIEHVLSRRSESLDENEKNTRKMLKTLSKPSKSENMNEVFELTQNPFLLEQALSQNPDLCSAAGGILLRKSEQMNRMLGYSVAFLAANMLAGKILPKPVQKALNVGFLAMDAFNVAEMVRAQNALNREFGNSLTETQISLGVQELADMNATFLKNKAMFAAFGVPSAMGLKKDAAPLFRWAKSKIVK